MARNKHSSPTLNVKITEAERATAVQSSSGGCLIADAIKKQYPQLTNVVVDMATIRATDKARGERYTYLTPPAAQHLLLAFDQGWPHPAQSEQVVVKRAVQIFPVIKSRTDTRARAQRLSQLEAGEQAGTLTRYQRAGLARLRNNPNPNPPPTRGKAEVRITRKSGSGSGGSYGAVIRGGNPRVQGPAHPNLLRGRDRHFGAKLADPGQAFSEAVEAAVQARMGNHEGVAS